MIRILFLLMVMFTGLVNTAYSACDSTNNGYFCLPQQGTSGAAERLLFFNSLQFADGIMGLMRSANYWTNGANSTLTGETDLESADLDITGSWNFSAGKVMNPKGTTLPTTDCDASNEAGRIFIKTNAPTGQQLYVCEGLAGWVLSSGSGSGGLEWQNDGSVIYSSPTLGNVGIGTINPQHTLEVSGTANITNALTVNNKDVCLEDGTNCQPSDAFDSTAFKNINWDNPGLLTPGKWIWNTGSTKPEAQFGNGTLDWYNTTMTVHGTTSQVKFANNMFINGDTARRICVGSTGGTTNESWCYDNDTVSNTIAVLSGTGVSLFDFQSISLKSVNITASGNVTAGTTGTAVNVLGSAGNISVGTEYVTAHIAPTNGGIIQGNVGIGTFSPVTPLQVVGTITATAFNTVSTDQATITLFEASANGTNKITINTPTSLSADRSCTLQDDSTPFDDCVSSSGGGSGINWSSYDDIVTLAQTDEFLVNNSGTNKSINWQYIENNLPFVQGYMGAVEFNPDNRETVKAVSSTATSVYNASTTNAPISFGAWIYARSNGRSTLGSIIDKGLGENTGKGYHIHLYAGNSSTAKIGSNVGCNDADADKATAADGASNGSVPLNQWVRVIATFNQDGDKKMKTYVNGAEISYASNTACTGNVGDDSALDLFIGNKKDGSVTFDGYIRDVFVSRGKAMTSAEVLADYNGQLSSGITARYAFTEGIGQYVHEFYGGNTAQTGTIASSVFTQAYLAWLSPARSFIGGNMGIGTTIPTATMHIVNPLTVDTFRIDDSNGDTTPFVVTSAGNVGIGTYSPTALSKVQVIGTVTATAFVGDGSGLTGVPAASGAGGWEDGGTNVYNSATTDNVGIGTTTPTATLLVENAVSTIDSFRVNDSAADGTPFIISSNGNVGIGTTTSAKQLVVGSTGQVTFDNSGNVVFSSSTGSTDTLNISNNSLTSGNALDVSSSSASQTVPLGIFTQSSTSSGGTLRINQSNASSTGRALHVTNAGTFDSLLVEDVATDTTPFIINSAGNVGIGTTNPAGTFVLFPAAAQAGQAACWTTNGVAGYCTTVVGAGGGCTCTAL